MKKLPFFATLVALMLVHMQLHAAPILSSFDTPEVFFGGDWTLGYAFSSDTNVSVTALGFYDYELDGLSAGHQVGLWDNSGTLLGQVSLSAGTGNTLIDGFRYANLASSINLLSGVTYFLAGTTSGDDWVYQASNIVMDTGMNYLGSYYGNGVLAFPEFDASSREYMTVNALTSAASVPEPATLVLFGLGLVGAGFLRKKKTA